MKTYTLHGTAPGESPRAARATSAQSQQQPKPHVYPDTRNQAISDDEVQWLGMAAGKAFAVHRAELERECAEQGTTYLAWAKAAAGTATRYAEQWRHLQVKQATAGRASRTREVKRADYRNVLGQFLNLAGMTEAAFRAFVKTGPAKNGEPRENEEQAARAVHGELRKLEAFFAWQVEGVKVEGESESARRGRVRDEAARRCAAYFDSVKRWKEGQTGKPWDQWQSRAQWNLYYTLKNRRADLMQKAGHPDAPESGPEARNVRQRIDRLRRDRSGDAPEAPVSERRPVTAPAPAGARHFV